MSHPASFTSTTPLRSTSEPNQAWKDVLRKEIEESLRPMFDEAKDTFQQKLKEADPFDTATLDKLKQDHADTLQNIHRIADDLFADGLFQHRKRMKGDGGDGLLPGESIMEQQQRILEDIARQQQAGSAPGPTPSPQPTRPRPSRQNSQRTTPAEMPTTVDRDGEYFSTRPLNRNVPPISPSRGEERIVGRPRGTSASNRHETRFSGERQEYSRSPTVDSPDEVDPPPLSFTEPSSGSFRRGNSNAGHRQPVPEIWKPSISPEEDVLISRTSTVARRSSVTSMSSGSYRSPGTTQFADRPDPTLNRQTSMSNMAPSSFRSSSGAQFSDRIEHKVVARQGSISSIGAQSYRPPSTHKIPERPESEETDGSESESDLEDVDPRVRRERMTIDAVEEEWSNIQKTRRRDDQQGRGRGRGSRYRSASGARRNVDPYGSTPSPSSAGPSPITTHSPSAAYSVTSARPVEVPQGSRPSGLSTSRPMSSERTHTSEEVPRQSPMSSSPLATEFITAPRGPKKRRGEKWVFPSFTFCA